MKQSTQTLALDAQQAEKAQRRLIAEGIVSASQDSLTRGIVLLAYALLLGANTFQIGLLSTANMIGSSFQLLADRLIRKLGSRKRLAVGSLGALAVLRALLGLLPLAAMWIAAEHLAWGLLSGLLIVSGAQQIAEVVRLSWVAEVVAEEERGRFLGERQFVVQLVASSVAIAAAWTLDWQRAISDAQGLFTAQTFFIVASVLGIASIFIIRTVPEPDTIPTRQTRSWTFIIQPFANARFRPLMAHYAIWHFAVAFAGPFFDLYLITAVGLPLGVVASLAFMGELASIYAVRFWGQLADRFGNLPVLRICAFSKAVFPFAWILLWPPQSVGGKVFVYAMAVIVHLWRVFNSGQQLTTVNLALKLMPTDQRTSYLATFRTLGNWIHAFSPAIGGLLAVALQNHGWPSRWSIAVLFAVSGIGRFGALYALSWVREPRAKRIRALWKAMRRLPGVLPGHGLRSMAKFWGAPVYSGFVFVRLRLGRMVNNWRGTPNMDER